jgi:signal transduction histidine kinase/CheY-like chemotaxis protein
MNVDPEVGKIARTLAEIAHALDAVDAPDARVQRALDLTAGLVPFARCAFLDAGHGDEPRLHVVPRADEANTVELKQDLMRLFLLVSDARGAGRSARAHSYIALPVMGLDSVIGVIRVEPAPGQAYEAWHVRLLSVVGAQLGAYLTLVRALANEARRASELQAANEFQQKLVGVVGHDLRTPLSVIINAATNLLRETTDPRQAEAVRRTLRNAQTAARIIGDLLDVTQTRVSGLMPIQAEPLDIVEQVRQVVEDVRSAHPLREVEFVSGEPQLEGEWDAGRLSQIVTNLLNNALTHGYPSSTITVSLESSGEGARLEVHNWGLPIPQELRDALFDPFVRGGKGFRRGPSAGLGLGLYIVEQAARAHGGSVAVESSEYKGTTFTVDLPRHPAGVERHEASAASAGTGARGLVMVVDDDADVRDSMAELLRHQGYDVAQAGNGAEALEQLRGGLRPKLILLDLDMPVMGGREFCEACSNDSELATIPIFIVSGNTEEVASDSRPDAAAYFTKPVAVRPLLSAVERHSH